MARYTGVVNASAVAIWQEFFTYHLSTAANTYLPEFLSCRLRRYSKNFTVTLFHKPLYVYNQLYFVHYTKLYNSYKSPIILIHI